MRAIGFFTGRRLLITFLLLFACGAATIAGWTATRSRALTPLFEAGPPTATLAMFHDQVIVAKPTYTPSPTLPPPPTPTSTLEPTLTPAALLAEIVVDTPTSGLAGPAGGAPYTGSKLILVDISEQHMYVYEGEQLVYSFVASTGMRNATRVGTFSVLEKIPNAYGATWNIWMPNWMGIYWAGSLENGIHALPILSSGARLWAGYLGSPISFGCVVLGVEESQLLFDWADVGTPVVIQW